MKELTANEIKFIKETGWTPTVVQCSEWYRTIWTDEKVDTTSENYLAQRDEYDAKYLVISSAQAKEKYNVDLEQLYNKLCSVEDSDGISLEYDATYLLYTFFTKEELLELDTAWVLAWLQDFKYYFGYRKWAESDVEAAILEAIEIHAGTREFYLTEDGYVWNREKED